MHVFANFAGGKMEEKLARSTFTFDFHCCAGGGRARRRDAVSLAQSRGPFHSSLGGAGAVSGDCAFNDLFGLYSFAQTICRPKLQE